MSTESTAAATELGNGQYRIIYYYEDDITELASTERGQIAIYLLELHDPDSSGVESKGFEKNLRLLDIIEDPDGYEGGHTLERMTDGGIITLDTTY